MLDACSKNGNGTGKIDKRNVGPSQLDQRLDRHNRKRIGEQRPQARRRSRVATCLRNVTSVCRGSCRPGENQALVQYPSNPPVFDDLDGLLQHPIGRCCVTEFGCHQESLSERQRSQRQIADADRAVDSVSEDGVGQIQTVFQ